MFAENLALKLIGLITTVVILGAVYLFIVKPVLDTTNRAFDTVDSSFDSIEDDFNNAGINGVDINDLQNGNFNDIQQQLNDSGLSDKDQRRAEKLIKCIQRVQPDTTKMQACQSKYGL